MSIAIVYVQGYTHVCNGSRVNAEYIIYIQN